MREWREVMGETQASLAALSGVGEHTISRIESGADTRPSTARKLARTLDVAVIDLVGRPPARVGYALSEAFASEADARVTPR